MQGLRSLFEDHYVTLPDEKYDVFESMVAKLDDMEDKLNEQIQANVALSGQMSGFPERRHSGRCILGSNPGCKGQTLRTLRECRV